MISSCAGGVKSEVPGDVIPRVENGIEVGQDNLGMDSVDERMCATQQERSGMTYSAISRDDGESCIFHILR